MFLLGVVYGRVSDFDDMRTPKRTTDLGEAQAYFVINVVKSKLESCAVGFGRSRTWPSGRSEGARFARRAAAMLYSSGSLGVRTPYLAPTAQEETGTAHI